VAGGQQTKKKTNKEAANDGKTVTVMIIAVRRRPVLSFCYSPL
jgi:hypothetical protein